MKKILVVEDEQMIAILLKYNLEQAGFEVITAGDGQKGEQLALLNHFDVILLDIMLPKKDGIEVCRSLREQKVFTPIMMLTAKDDEHDKIWGLELGADDYMTKPFSPREVVTRVKALLRRADFNREQSKVSDKIQSENTVMIGDLEIYVDRYLATFCGKKLELTKKEFELLLCLASHPGEVFSRDQLLKDIWQTDFAGDSRMVDVHISNLRDKIERDSKNPQYIKTIRGLGYKFEEQINWKRTEQMSDIGSFRI